MIRIRTKTSLLHSTIFTVRWLKRMKIQYATWQIIVITSKLAKSMVFVNMEALSTSVEQAKRMQGNYLE